MFRAPRLILLLFVTAGTYFGCDVSYGSPDPTPWPGRDAAAASFVGAAPQCGRTASTRDGPPRCGDGDPKLLGAP